MQLRFEALKMAVTYLAQANVKSDKSPIQLADEFYKFLTTKSIATPQ